MSTLVTGATGFVGNRIALALLERGEPVRVLARDPKRAAALRQRGAEVVLADVRDAAALHKALDGVQRVYHCAALVGDWLDPVAARRVNVEGTRTVLAAAAATGVRRVVHISSLSVLGTMHHHGTAEAAPYRYGDPYTDTKIDSERAVLDFGRRGELETVALRPGFVYGPGDHQLLPRLLETLANGQFRFIGDGGKEMNTIYIDDLARCALLAGDNAAAAGQAYNLTDGANTPVRDFVAAIAAALHIPVPRRHVPVPLAFVGCYGLEFFARLTRAQEAPRLNRSRLRFLHFNQRYSIEKARSELGYAPQFTYHEGLPPTLDWFRQQGLLPQAFAPSVALAS